MKTIIRLLVVMLMSVSTSGAFAQASKKNDAVKLSVEDVARIKRYLPKNTFFSVEDSVLVEDLLRSDNEPRTGVLDQKIEFYEQAEIGDNWTAYISRDNGTFWLTYVFRRNGKFVGRIDTRID